MKLPGLPVAQGAGARKRPAFAGTLRARFLALALIAVALFTVGSIYEGLDERLGEELQARTHAEALAREGAVRLDEYLAKVDVVLGLAAVAIQPQLDGRERLDEALKTIHRGLPPTFSSLSVLGPEGRMIGSATVPRPAQPGLDMSDRSFFRIAADERRFAVSKPFKGAVLTEHIVVAARPIVDANQRLRAVISATTKLDAVERIAAPALAPHGARVSLHLADGSLVVAQVAPEAQTADLAVITGEASLTRTEWLVRVAIPRSVALAEADARLWRGALVALTASAALGLFILWFGFRISRPIERVRAGAARLAAGELSHRVAASGDSEIERLARDFNAMASELERQRDALIESDRRWQFALEGAGATVWEWSDATRRQFHSPRAFPMLGLEAQPIIDGSEWAGRVHPDDVAAVRAAMRALLKQPSATTVIEYRMRHADGSWRWIEGRGTAVARAADGQAMRVIGTNTDITDRKLAEARLARLGRLLAALNAMNETIARVHAPDELYRRLCGIAAEHSDLRLATVRLVDEARGYLTTVAHSGPQPAYHDDARIDDPTGLARGRASLVALHEGRVVVVNDIRQAAGGTEWGAASLARGVNATVSAPVRRARRVTGLLSFFASEAGYFDDELVGLIERMGESLSFALDNFDRETERRAAEERLRASEERFRTLTEASSDWFWEQDEHCRFTFISENVYDKRGIPAADCIGKTPWELPAVDLTGVDWVSHRAQLERHEPFREFEIQRPDRDGRPRWAGISGRPIFDAAGRFTGYRGIGRDITARKLAELEVMRLLAEKEALAERLREQFASMPIGCMLFDAEHRITYANLAAERIFGVAAAELIGSELEHYIDPGLL